MYIYLCSLLFWTIPFDATSWILLAISILTITVVLRGNWMNVVGILLRQGVSGLRQNKVLVVLMLISTAVTCCYESIISGFLTIPPPVVIVTTLKDLVDMNYKIVTLGIVEYSELEEVFNREHITSHSLKSSFLNDTNTVPMDEVLLEVAAGKATLALQQTANILFYNIGDKICYTASQTLFSRPYPALFNGHDRWRFFKWMRFLKESGIMSMYEDFANYVSDIPIRRRQEFNAQAESQPLAFYMSDWKISSIFLMWIVLTGFSCIGFVAEYTYKLRNINYAFNNLVCALKISKCRFQRK